MISIGAVYRGPELRDSHINRVISASMQSAMKIRSELESASRPSVNVIFYVPGSLGEPDWDGLREAKFSLRQKLLMVQVAVPQEVVDSATPEDYVIESLYGANAVAFEFFRQKQMQFPLAEAEQLVKSIASSVSKAVRGK